MRLVRLEIDRWIFSGESIHLPKESSLVNQHHANWRSRAMVSQGEVQYSGVQSLSEEAAEKIKRDLVKAIDAAVKVAEPSPPEKLVCLNVDFFEV